MISTTFTRLYVCTMLDFMVNACRVKRDQSVLPLLIDVMFSIELRGSLSERSSRVIELEQEVEVLEGELSAAQQAAKQAPSRSMKALVERLRNQLSVKEKQQRVGSLVIDKVHPPSIYVCVVKYVCTCLSPLKPCFYEHV